MNETTVETLGLGKTQEVPWSSAAQVGLVIVDSNSFSNTELLQYNLSFRI